MSGCFRVLIGIAIQRHRCCRGKKTTYVDQAFDSKKEQFGVYHFLLQELKASDRQWWLVVVFVGGKSLKNWVWSTIS